MDRPAQRRQKKSVANQGIFQICLLTDVRMLVRIKKLLRDYVAALLELEEQRGFEIAEEEYEIKKREILSE